MKSGLIDLNSMIGIHSDGIKIKGHKGKWYVVEWKHDFQHGNIFFTGT